MSVVGRYTELSEELENKATANILLGDAEQLSACSTVLLGEEAGIPGVLLLSLLGHAHLNLCGAERFVNFIDYDSLSFEIFQGYCLFRRLEFFLAKVLHRHIINICIVGGLVSTFLIVAVVSHRVWVC